jgi:flagellar biosynthesis/type III secretory pathway M-ring protein FliF/YscJ
MAPLAVLTTLNSSLAQTTIVLAQEDEDAASNAGTALVVFLVVMIVVVGVLAALQQRRKTLLMNPEADERTVEDENARRDSFESKMRRVEERLRGQDDELGSSDSLESPREAGPSPELE